MVIQKKYFNRAMSGYSYNTFNVQAI